MSKPSNMAIIIAAGSVVLIISWGVRSIFGIVLDPISDTFGWPREVFSTALAIQNITWGLGQPVFGWIADRFGDRRALWLGFAAYLLGMLVSAYGQTPMSQFAGAGLLVGLGITGSAYGLILSIVGRAAPEEKRSQALALTAAFGSLGQMATPAIAGLLVEAVGWQNTLLVFAAVLLPMAICIPLLKAEVPAASAAPSDDLSTRALMARAFGHPSYVLLVSGFFVCGFHVAFIAAHFPAFVAEMCATPDGPATELGALTLSIVGIANFLATLAIGRLGARYPKNGILAIIYALRAVVIAVFISLPITPASVLIFSAVFGTLWLTTVPLTAGLVATMFGARNMATLNGIVFLSHQVGSFVGIYMGGRVYDLYGNYDLVWYAAIALGVFSSIVHLPVRDRAWEPRPQAA